jgi:hypothetical protein
MHGNSCGKFWRLCRRGEAAERRQKAFIGFVRSCYLCALIRGLQNLEVLLKKVLIVAVRSCHCGALFRGLRNLGASLKGFNCCGAKLRLRRADLRFGKPRNSLQGRTGCYFLRRAKSNQKARQRFANLWTPGTIQSSVGSDFAEIFGGSCRNRFCLQNAGEKALNRCERVTVVQTQD